MNNALFILIVTGFFIDIKKKKDNQISRILGISIVGIALFLMLWEARSRYIYFLIPVFCILGAMGLTNISNITKNKNQTNLIKERN